MGSEAGTLWSYIKALCQHWWAIVPGVLLTVLDLVERALGTWYRFPLWAIITTGVLGLAVAQYLAYRELAKSAPDPISDFKGRVREAYRAAELEWTETTKAEWVPAPAICKQVDVFSDGLTMLYSQAPVTWDSEPLRRVIERLRATRNLRVGNNIPSKDEGDKICAEMDAALADIRAMLT